MGINSALLDFYEKNVINDNKLDKSKNNLEIYLENLRNARHNLLHENKVNMDFMTIEAYITWFPLFFLITLFENKLTQVDIPRLIFFIKLLQLDLNKWNEKNPKYYNTHYKDTWYESIFPNLTLEVKSNIKLYEKGNTLGGIEYENKNN